MRYATELANDGSVLFEVESNTRLCFLCAIYSTLGSGSDTLSCNDVCILMDAIPLQKPVRQCPLWKYEYSIFASNCFMTFTGWLNVWYYF